MNHLFHRSLSGTKFENQNSSIISTPDTVPKSRTNVHQARIVKLLDDLKLALELCDDKKRIIRQVPEDVVKFVGEWLNSGAAEVRQVGVMYYIKYAVIFLNLWAALTFDEITFKVHALGKASK